jgi:hypothetical protein
MSVSYFVPKPFTPFQWTGQDTYDTIMGKQRAIKQALRRKQVRFSYHDSLQSIVEAARARGDRRLGRVIMAAWRGGARFEGWSEFFRYEIWAKAFAEEGLSVDFYAYRERGFDEILPWDHIDAGISKAFLIREAEKAKIAATTQNCRDGCGGCGFVKKEGGCVDA